MSLIHATNMGVNEKSNTNLAVAITAMTKRLVILEKLQILAGKKVLN